MIKTDTAIIRAPTPREWAPKGILANIASRAIAVLYEWQERASTRHRLMTLDGRMLKDIGLSAADAEREGRKPFWLR